MRDLPQRRGVSDRDVQAEVQCPVENDHAGVAEQDGEDGRDKPKDGDDIHSGDVAVIFNRPERPQGTRRNLDGYGQQVGGTGD